MYYVDTNIWIYAMIAHPIYGPRCKKVLEDIETGKLDALISTQVLSEVAGVLYSQYGVKDTTKHIAAMISYPIEIATVTINTIRSAAEYARDYDILPYDGIHVSSAMEQGTTQIVSADRELDKIDIMKRIDPLQYQG